MGKNTRIITLFCFLLNIAGTWAQNTIIKADFLIDGKTDHGIVNPRVLVQDGKIVAVNYMDRLPDSTEVIDLTGYTLLPGLIDAHTHVLNGRGGFEKNLYNYSSAFKALRAVSHLKIALNNGFTTLRDLCNEGAGYADIDLRKALRAGYIEGPELLPATLGIAATGTYFPFVRNQNWELGLPAGTMYVTGVDECRKAVRTQISHGAKWIKVFADWGTMTLNPDELYSIVEEANKFGVEVAAHANKKKGIEAAIKAGARSIEHGGQFNRELIDQAVEKGIFWCPTATVKEHYGLASPEYYENLRYAYGKGMKIVLGTDVGSFPWSINQAKELEYYVTKIGMAPMDAVRSGTSVAAELLEMEHKIGKIEAGFIADIIAVKGNPLKDITLLQKVGFVMKNGTVYKRPQ